MLDKDSVGSMLGFRVFQRFYELTSKSKTPKSFEEFIHSKYYLAFVKFGRHLVDVNALNSNDFIDYVITNAFPIDDWCKDSVYIKFVKHYIENEHYERAIERSLLYMQDWCDKNTTPICRFFNEMSTFEATHLINTGKLSPWIMYLSKGGQRMIDRFSDDQMKIIGQTIDVDVWRKKFANNKGDVEFVKQVLTGAGL